MKFYNNVDFGQNQLLNGVIQNLGTAPSSPFAGQMYYNSTANVGYIWNGTAWRPMDAAALTDGSVPIAALAVNPLARANHTGTQLANTISNLQSTVITYTLDTFAAPVASVNMNSQKITSLASGVASTDAVNVGQMNSSIAAAIAGQTSVKNPVRVIATANITLSGLQTIDGVSLAAGDRVLASAQTTASQNNVYVVASGAWTLATDVNTTGDLIEGTELLVNEGTIYAGTIWRVTTQGTITIGTTSITWTQTAKINTYTADGVTLSLTGFQFAVKYDTATLTTDASGLTVNTANVPKKYTGTITHDGSTTAFAITHNLNNSTPITVVRDSSGNEVLVNNQATSANAVTFTWSVAQTSGTTFTYTIVG